MLWDRPFPLRLQLERGVSADRHVRIYFYSLSICDSHQQQFSRVHNVSIGGPAPEKGTRVDSISYYTHELAESNKDVFVLQKRKAEVAASGNASSRAFDWLARAADWSGLTAAAATIMEDSVEDNALLSPHDSIDSIHDSMALNGSEIPQAENMTSMYGSFAPIAVPSLNGPSQKMLSLGAIAELNSRSESWPDTSIGSDSKSRPLMARESMVSSLLLNSLATEYRTSPIIWSDNLPCHTRIDRNWPMKTREDSLHRADVTKKGALFEGLLADWGLIF